MLTIRMQRTGRKAKASFRIVVQDSRFTPTSGRVVAQLGHYDPHTKEVVVDSKKAEQYLTNGAQPSERVVRLFQAQKITMPDWVDQPRTDRASKTRHAEKLRRNQPKKAVQEAPEPTAEKAPTEEVLAEEPVAEAAPVEKVETDAKSEEKVPETVAKEPASKEA